MVLALWLAGVLAVPAPGAARSADTRSLLPPADAIAGWPAGEERSVTTEKDLFDYMDGGAEVYIDYGFVDLAAGEWMSPEGNPVKVEIYRMSRPKGAFGMFTQDTWGDSVDVGQAGRIQGGTLRFWEGEYFVRVFMWRGYQEHMDTLKLLAEQVAGRIPTEGAIPDVMARLPEAGLAEGGLHFFSTALTLGTFYYLSEQNPLGLTRETDGAIGEYPLEDGSSAFLVLVEYPEPAKARAALEALAAEIGVSDAVPDEGGFPSLVLVTQTDGLWRKAVARGVHLALSLDAPDEATAARLLEPLLAALEPPAKAEKTPSCPE